MSFRLVTYNLRFGGRGREAALTSVLKGLRADLVILQEASRPSVVEGLARGTGASLWASRRGLSLGFISRGSVSQWRWHNMPGLKHPVLETVLRDDSFSVYGVHLRPHLFKWREKQRIGEIRSLFEITSSKDGKRAPHVIVGDFNSIAPGDEARIDRMPAWIRGGIRVSGGRILTEAVEHVLRAGYTDGFRRRHPGDKGFTFPSSSPRLRLDYVFLSPDLQERLVSCRVADDRPEAQSASDHLPLLTVLTD
jgi:exodeoxyribonuclease-3